MFKELSKVFSIFRKTATKTSDAIGGSLTFMDKLIEEEYIVNAFGAIKETAGKAIEKSGTMYQVSKDKLDELLDKEKLTAFIHDKAEEGNEHYKSMKEAMDNGQLSIDNFIEQLKEKFSEEE